MKKFKYLFFIVILFMHYSSLAQKGILLRSPTTPMEEFNSYVQVENSTSYSHYLLKKIQNQKKELKDFHNLLEQAQRSFLTGYLKNASELFKTITDMAYSKDWNQEAREIIFYSFLRQAQIEKENNKTNMHKHSAIMFAYDMNPDAQLFSPPFIKEYDFVKKNIPKTLIVLKNIFPFHESIIINGRFFSNKEKVKLPLGEYRITALSSSHTKWGKKISLTELQGRKILGKSFVRGSCKKPVENEFLKDKTILFPEFCIWSYKLNSHSKDIVSKNILSSPLPFFPKKKSFFRRNLKWFILGAGALLLTGIVIVTKRGKPASSEKNQKPLINETSSSSSSPSPSPSSSKKTKPPLKKPNKHKPTITIGF